MITREQRLMQVTVAKLVVFILISSVLGGMVIVVLRGHPVGTTDLFRAQFADVSGLKPGDTVRVSGVIVGKVEQVKLVRPGDVEVKFAVNRNQAITTSTHAVVRYANLLGQRYLALTQVGAPGQALSKGTLIPPARTAPALSLTALFNGFQPLFSSLSPSDVNRLTAEIVGMLQGQGGTIDGLFAETARLTTNLAARDDEFKQVIDSFSKLAAVVAQHDSGLATMLDSINRLSGQLAGDSAGIDDALVAVGGLTSSVRTLLSGVRAADPRAMTADLALLARTAARNEALLSQTLDAFPQAFTTFNRLTQNGGWINAYPCTFSASLIGSPTVTSDQIATLILAYTGGGSGIASTVGSLITGLFPVKAKIPIQIPVGPVGPVGRSDSGTAVCR